MFTFDAGSIRALRPEIVAALAALCAKHGITATAGNARFVREGTSATITLEFARVNEAGVAETQERTAWAQHCATLGLKPEWLDQCITTSNGREYKLVGIDPRRWKYPVVGEDTHTGERRIFAAESVIRALAPRGQAVGLTPALRAKFESLASRLSPENLSCDGELSRTAVAQKERRLLAEWAVLESEVGHKVDIQAIERAASERYLKEAGIR